MGYLDYAGLQYLWGKLKEKFAPKSHNHDDRYYTESEMDGMLNSKVNNNEAGANGLLSKLAVWTATPTDDTYFMRQDTGGGNSFGRAKFSTLWNYIKGKADGMYQPKGSYAASGHTHDDRYYTESEMDGKLNSKVGFSKVSAALVAQPGNNPYIGNVEGEDVGIGEGSYYSVINLGSYSGGNFRSQIAVPYQDGIADSNMYIRTAKNATWRPWRKIIHSGNIGQQTVAKANVADSANFAKETYISQYKTVNLTDLDQNTWYPVTGTAIPSNGLRHFKCSVHLNSGSKPNWSTHSSGFTAVVDILEESSGWGTTGMLGEVLINDQRFIADESKPPVGYSQMDWGSIPVWWLRGGGSYRLATDYDVTWTIQKSTYTNNGRTVSPTTNYPGVSVNRSTITANLNGTAVKADTADKATSADYLNFTVGNEINFNGTPSNNYVCFGYRNSSINEYKFFNGNTGLATVTAASFNGKATSAGTADVANAVDWSKVQNKPSSYPPSSHTHAYLPTAGGTMTGDVSFSSIGDTATSKKIRWNGSTDGADIYYQTTVSDQGNLVINLRDDSNCYLRIAKNGVFKSYFSPDDGNFHGNVNGTADTATSATTSNGIKDYNDANRTIQIGFAGSGLNTSNLNYIAGYTDNGTKIKDVSKDVLTSWIGLGNYLPLSGGTMGGRIVRSGGGSFISDRDNVAVFGNSYGQSAGNSYNPVIGQKTSSGAWTIGNLSGSESLSFNYTTDSNYNAGNNSCARVDLPAQDGTIITSATIGGQSVNYANSAGSATNATNATNATTATKLDSNAGSSIQPVYFSGGKPVAIGYTIAKSVPTDAKFTDTNTWRGIQNNLTSDSATDSLSAAQGKALKSLIDGKAASGHTHSFDSITGKPSTYTPSAHTHDDRYYTEGEVDSKLNGKSDTSHTHYSITTVADKRNDNTTPNDYRNTFIFQGLKTNSKIGSPSSDTYSYLLGLRGWNDSSGGDSHELAFNDTGIYWRHGATTGWNGWNRVYTDNYHPNAGYANTASSATNASYLNFTSGNEINFTGTPQNSTVYIGYRNTSVNEYKFNNGNGGGGLAIVTAASFNGKATSAGTADTATNATNATNATTATKLSSSAGSNTQPVYFSGGKPVAIGYTIASSVPADAKFTDTTYSVATSSSNGLMSSTDKTKLDDFSRVISIQKQVKLTTDWQDTGIAGNNLDTGTYVVQVSGFNSSYTYLYNEIFSGVMSWYSGDTNSLNSDEIFLHNAGHASNGNHIYLRTVRKSSGNGGLRLQIASKIAASGTDTLTFKFRRLI